MHGLKIFPVLSFPSFFSIFLEISKQLLWEINIWLQIKTEIFKTLKYKSTYSIAFSGVIWSHVIQSLENPTIYSWEEENEKTKTYEFYYEIIFTSQTLRKGHGVPPRVFIQYFENCYYRELKDGQIFNCNMFACIQLLQSSS